MTGDEYHTLLKEIKSFLQGLGLSGVERFYVRDRATLLREEVRECRRCALSSTRVSSFAGCESGRVLFVDSVPTAVEGQPKPFEGERGELLLKVIKSMKLPENETALTYAARCVVPAPVEEAPLIEAARACAGFLREEIRAMRPVVAVALGPAACMSLFGSADVESLRGRVHELCGTSAVATYGIDAMMPDKGLRALAWKDIQMAIRLLKG